MSERIEGKCQCGACVVSIVPAEDTVHICYCDMCRAWTGPGMMAAKCAPNDLRYEGPVKTRQSSPWAERAWCDECGSSLFYRVTADGKWQGVAHVSVGLFPNAAGLTLAGELYTERRPEGYAFKGDLHGLTGAELEAMFAGGDA